MNGRYVPEPDNFGLRFAGLFAGATMIPVDFDPGAVNATAYAGTLPTGQVQIAIINKDEHLPLHLDLASFSIAQQLTAPSLTALSAQLDEPQSFREASLVPPASAMLLAATRMPAM